MVKEFYCYSNLIRLAIRLTILFNSMVSCNLLFSVDYYEITDYFKQIFVPTKEITTNDYNMNNIKTVEIKNNKGSLSIKTWKEPKMIIKCIKKGSDKDRTDTHSYVTVKDQHALVETKTLKNQAYITTDYEIIIPENIALKATTGKGSIKIKDCNASIQASILDQGNIKLSNITKTTLAKTHKGSIKIKQKELTKPDTIFLECLQGNIILKLPKDINAQLQARTQKGTITSTFPVTLYPQKVKLNKEYWNQVKQEVFGTLGKGGCSIIIDVKKGNIKLEE